MTESLTLRRLFLSKFVSICESIFVLSAKPNRTENRRIFVVLQSILIFDRTFGYVKIFTKYFFIYFD